MGAKNAFPSQRKTQDPTIPTFNSKAVTKNGNSI